MNSVRIVHYVLCTIIAIFYLDVSAKNDVDLYNVDIVQNI